MEETAKHFFVVRGVSTERCLPWYASTNMDFEPFSNEGGPLHESRFRAKLRRFPTREAAAAFVRQYGQKTHRTVNSIVIEPATENLESSYENFNSERRRILSRLLPLVDNILNNFDFTRVRKTIALTDGPDRQPTIADLKTIARDLLTGAVNEDNDAYRGLYQKSGFHAWRNSNELTLSFEIASTRAQARQSNSSGVFR